ncbi:hypothetical protein ACMGD3_16720 [Lysinibacillus sphaericus]|uniref:hypothetical protein n=1 Tax=Lysinibacillus sphaericus TaxID=1421 RepID=UPI003F79A05A
MFDFINDSGYATGDVWLSSGDSCYATGDVTHSGGDFYYVTGGVTHSSGDSYFAISDVRHFISDFTLLSALIAIHPNKKTVPTIICRDCLHIELFFCPA